MDFFSLATVLLVILITSVLASYIKILLGKSKLPPGPTPLPIIGTLHLMNFKDIVKSLMDLSKKYGDIFTVYEGSKPIIVLCSYKAIKETFIDKAEEFSGRAYCPAFSDFTKGDELAFSNGEKWKELRRFSMQTLGNFGVGKRSFEERIREEAMYLTKALRKANGAPIDPNYHLLSSISNVICSVVFGSRFEYKDENFQKLVKCIQDNVRIMSSCWGICHAITCGQGLIGDNFILQLDNDPKHISKLCMNYLGKKRAAGILSVMEWPVQSPDLNPTELLWEQLDRMVGKKCPSSQSTLWEVFRKRGVKFLKIYLSKLAARMPKV